MNGNIVERGCWRLYIIWDLVHIAGEFLDALGELKASTCCYFDEHPPTARTSGQAQLETYVEKGVKFICRE